MKQYFAGNLKKLRKNADITQEKLAECLGVLPQTVSKWERAETYPDIETLPSLSNFFDVTIRDGKAENAYFAVALSEKEKALLTAYEGKTVVLGVRPENISTGGNVDVTVFSNENLGMNTLVHGRLSGVTAADSSITCKLRGWCDYKRGDQVKVSFTKCHFFDKETTNAIR